MAKGFDWKKEAWATFGQLKVGIHDCVNPYALQSGATYYLRSRCLDICIGCNSPPIGPGEKNLSNCILQQEVQPYRIDYDIYEKEMLANVNSLKHYHYLFEGLGQQITIYSDYYSLLWFMKTKVSNQPQARWTEKLVKYDFVIQFHSRMQGEKPDALFHWPDYVLENKVRQLISFLCPEQADITKLKIGA